MSPGTSGAFQINCGNNQSISRLRVRVRKTSQSRTHLALFPGRDQRVLEQLACLDIGPIHGGRFLRVLEHLDNGLERAMFLDELVSRLGTNTWDGLEVIATAQHAHVDELVRRSLGVSLCFATAPWMTPLLLQLTSSMVISMPVSTSARVITSTGIFLASEKVMWRNRTVELNVSVSMSSDPAAYTYSLAEHQLTRSWGISAAAALLPGPHDTILHTELRPRRVPSRAQEKR